MLGKIVAIILHAANMRGYVCSPLEMQNTFTYSLHYETDALLCYKVIIFMHVYSVSNLRINGTVALKGMIKTFDAP